ncbi:MAG: diguanylate cyclase [Spirochaetales bacterium]|nr:diguanylate cyclase [Spirochaetales bacterium]
MKKAVAITYATFSFIAFTAVIFVTGFLLYEQYDKNRIEFLNRFEGIREKALAWYTADPSFESESFSGGTASFLRAEERLFIVSLYSPRQGLLYSIEKTGKNSPSFLKSRIIPDTGSLDPAWKGEPEYKRLPIHFQRMKLKFSLEPELFLEAVYTPLTKTEISLVIKWGLFGLIVWLMLSIIIRLFISGGTRNDTPVRPAGTFTGEPLPDGFFGEEPYEIQTEEITEPPLPAHRQSEQKEFTGAGSRAPEHETYEAVRHKGARDLFSPATSLGWEDHLSQRLQFEINRTASSNQDLVMVLIGIDNYTNLLRGESIYRNIARCILDNFPFQDLAFEYGEARFAIILPDMELHNGIKEMELFQKKINQSMFEDQHVTVSIGLASRNGRLLSGTILINEAVKALEKAIEAGRNKIIAFKSDPEKYRKVLSAKMDRKK